MKVVCIYRDQSDAARDVENWLHEFDARTSGAAIELLNPDTRAGADFCRLYDIVEYPTIVAITDDGRLLNLWRGLPLPLVDHVAKYA